MQVMIPKCGYITRSIAMWVHEFTYLYAIAHGMVHFADPVRI
jgi:hypothetical protein